MIGGLSSFGLSAPDVWAIGCPIDDAQRDRGDESDHIRDLSRQAAPPPNSSSVVPPSVSLTSPATAGEEPGCGGSSEALAGERTQAKDLRLQSGAGSPHSKCGSCLEPTHFLVLGLCQACADFHGFSPTSS
jgi:hypothetical protein